MTNHERNKHENKIEKMVRHKVCNTVLKKYKLIKFRSKLSFTAL